MSESLDDLLKNSTRLRDEGRWEEALAFALQAIEASPRDYQAHISHGLCLLVGRRLEEAGLAFNRAIVLEPDDAAAYTFVAETRRLQGSYDRAAKALRYAVERAPTAENFVALGTVLLNQFDYLAAEKCAAQCLARFPDSVGAHLVLCGALLQLGRMREATAHLEKAIELDPQREQALVIARRQRAFGHFEEAQQNYRLEIRRRPNTLRAYAELMQSQRTTEADRPLVNAARALLRKPLGPAESIAIHYGLGKALEDLGEYEEAMFHYDEANGVTRAVKLGAEGFDRSEHTAMIDKMLRIQSADLPSPGFAYSRSELPILIVGMMRSGTTLCEQILSNHPKIAAAGELMFWAHQWPSAVVEGGDSLDPQRVANLGREYCATLEMHGSEATRVTDKFPGNFLALGLILKAVPHARVIHMRRSPIDTCLSIWATPNDALSDGNHNKSDLVFAYKEYLRVMKFWRSVLPADRVLEVDYEALTSSPETTIRRMVEFCGVEWDEACLHPETNKRVVATPSVWQVRQPLNRNSVERWKKFESVLGEFAELTNVVHPVVT